MAFEMDLYGRAGEPVAQRALAHLVADVERRDPLIQVSLDSDSVGWAGCELSSSRDPRASLDAVTRARISPEELARAPWPTSVVVNTRPDVVPEAVRELVELGAPPELPDCDVIVQICLVGRLTDWATVRVVWESAIGLWSAIPYAPDYGFATLDDLP